MKTIVYIIYILLLTLSANAWTPPIGIPAPNWGAALGNPIELPAPTPPENWTKNLPNYFYVEEGGTNSGNGYPGNPCGYIWSELPPGSIVFVNGTITRNHYQFTFREAGTAEAPIWILSYDPKKPAKFTRALEIGPTTSYLILENLHWQRVGASGGVVEMAGGVDHVCFRNCSITGPGTETGTEGTMDFHSTTMLVQNTEAYEGGTQQLVFYNTKFTKGGNWMYAEGDPDAHGVSFGKFVQDVWIVDCDFSYLSGCAVQIGAGTTGSTPDTDVSRRIYVGRCKADHIAQSAFWSKRADDVIFSQNVCHTMRRDTPSSPNSSGFGGQYGPRNFWIIYNTTYDCQSGSIVASSSLGAGANSTDVYLVGNIFHSIRATNCPVKPDWRRNAYSAEGVCVASWSQSAWVVGNTFYDYDAGILCPANALTWRISDNLFANRAGNLGTDVNVQDPGGKNVISRNLFENLYVENGDKTITALATLNSSKGSGNISGTPTFNNAPAADFRLQAGSVGVDAAGPDDNAVYDIFSARYGRSIRLDHNGTPRPQDGKWDMGAYEIKTEGGKGGGTPPSRPSGLRVKKGN